MPSFNSTAAHTAGPWDYFVGNANGRGLIRVEASVNSDDAGEHICSFPRGPKGEVHAALVAEVGTILHETGLTPSQLAEQRAKLLAALERIRSAVEMYGLDDFEETTTVELAAIDAAIAAAKGGAQ